MSAGNTLTLLLYLRERVWMGKLLRTVVFALHDVVSFFV